MSNKRSRLVPFLFRLRTGRGIGGKVGQEGPPQNLDPPSTRSFFASCVQSSKNQKDTLLRCDDSTTQRCKRRELVSALAVVQMLIWVALQIPNDLVSSGSLGPSPPHYT